MDHLFMSMTPEYFKLTEIQLQFHSWMALVYTKQDAQICGNKKLEF